MDKSLFSTNSNNCCIGPKDNKFHATPTSWTSLYCGHWLTTFSVPSLAELLHGAICMSFLGLYNKKFGMFAIFLFYIGLFMRDFKEVQ